MNRLEQIKQNLVNINLFDNPAGRMFMMDAIALIDAELSARSEQAKALDEQLERIERRCKTNSYDVVEAIQHARSLLASLRGQTVEAETVHFTGARRSGKSHKNKLLAALIGFDNREPDKCFEFWRKMEAWLEVNGEAPRKDADRENQ